jgi:hypothetical protein
VDKQEEPIHQRLNFLIDKLEEGVQRRLALRLGVTSGTIGDILGQRKSKPGYELLRKILLAYPQIRAEWLMLGEGQMLKSDRQKADPENTLSYGAGIAVPSAREPGVAAGLQSHDPTEEVEGPGAINFDLEPKKKKPVGSDLVQQIDRNTKQLAQNTADIKQIFELLRGNSSVGPDAPNGNAPGPEGARH